MRRTTRTFNAPKPASQIPKWFRPPPPPLSPDQIRDLGIVHHQNIDAIAKGEADEAILRDWVGGILTWSEAARLTGNGVPELDAQLALSNEVIERYKRTGRVGFTGTQLQLARDGAGYMDQLAEITPKHVAEQAADWCDKQLNELAFAQA